MKLLIAATAALSIAAGSGMTVARADTVVTPADPPPPIEFNGLACLVGPQLPIAITACTTCVLVHITDFPVVPNQTWVACVPLPDPGPLPPVPVTF